MDILEAANVVRSDGPWSRGYAFDSYGCVIQSFITDVCNPSRDRLSGDTEPAQTAVANVSNKELTSNVATLTVDSTYTWVVGQTVTVAGVDATFDGTYTLTGVTPTTISYAKVNADVASAADTGTVTGPAPDLVFGGVEAYIFGVVTSLKGRAICSEGQEPSWVEAAMDEETEKAVGRTLFDGNGGAADAYIDSVTHTVAEGATTADTVAALLAKFWDETVGVKQSETLLHLGISRVLKMPGLLEGDRLINTDIRVVTSSGYPADAAAVTGPVTVKLSSTQLLGEVDTRFNDVHNEATRLVSIEFDPCVAVRVA